MTEQEFKKQVWRAYDTVEIEGVADHARVIAVGFPSLSVRAAVAPGVVEWFKCDQITDHHSATGNPDDLAIIEDLHNKLMAANKRNEDLQQILNTQQERIKELKDKADGKPESKDLRKLRSTVASIYSTIGSIDHRMKQIDEYLDSLKANEDNQ